MHAGRRECVELSRHCRLHRRAHAGEPTSAAFPVPGVVRGGPRLATSAVIAWLICAAVYSLGYIAAGVGTIKAALACCSGVRCNRAALGRGADMISDPIEFELFKNALFGIADEMALTVFRTTYSGVLKDNMDYSTALFDGDGVLVAQGLTLPGHLGSMPTAIAAVQAAFAGQVHPGDVFILNDPFQGGMHLPDVFVFQPIFRPPPSPSPASPHPSLPRKR